MLIKNGHDLNIVLLDPLNISNERIPKYYPISRTFEHISKFLTSHYSSEKIHFFSFDLNRLKDEFNCGTYCIDDYEKMNDSYKAVIGAISAKSSGTTNGNCITTINPIPENILSSTQSLSTIEKLDPQLACKIRDTNGRVSKTDQIQNAYILQKMIEYTMLIIDNFVSFR